MFDPAWLECYRAAIIRPRGERTWKDNNFPHCRLSFATARQLPTYRLLRDSESTESINYTSAVSMHCKAPGDKCNIPIFCLRYIYSILDT